MFESSDMPSIHGSLESDASLSPDESPLVDGLKATADTPSAEKKSHGTFELKFLIDDDRASQIMDWARLHLGPDPHLDPEIGEGYRVNSLYLDTPEFDVYHRMPGHRRRKFRLRRYGRESLIYLEQKHKRQGLVRKKRIGVAETEVPLRLHSAADQEWNGHWFRKRLDEHLLKPVCQVVYQRFARVKSTDQGSLRLTIDNQLKARPFADWIVPQGELDGTILLDGKQILELKFRGAMPPLYRALIDDHQLQLTSFSKYRTSVDKCIPLSGIVGQSDQERRDA